MHLDLQALAAARPGLQPFPHLVVPGFLPPGQVADAIRDFPPLDMGGLFVPQILRFGPAFAGLLATLQGPELRRLVGEKLGVDLNGRPTLVTVRGCTQARDGRIHTDSRFKLATLLLYLNQPWRADGGRLRLLNSDSLDDYAAEVPPHGGTLVCFRVQPDSWHGHPPFVGIRRAVMMNWCRDEAVRDRELRRHVLSGRIKQVKRVLGIGRVATS
jgi:hypothetical protein